MKHIIWQGSMTGVKQLESGFMTYEIVWTRYSDGTETKEEKPGRVHLVEPIRVD